MASAAPKKAKAPKATKIAAPVEAETAAMVEAVAAPEPVQSAVVETPAIAEGLTKMTDTVKTAAAEAAEKATSFAKTAQEKAREGFAKSGELAKDVVAFHKGNLEAVVESAKAAATGIQAGAKDAMEIGRKDWEEAVAHVKSLTSVTSPSEFLKLQGEYARHRFDATIANFGKATEFATKLGGEMVAPLQNRYAVVAEGVKARLAA